MQGKLLCSVNLLGGIFDESSKSDNSDFGIRGD